MAAFQPRPGGCLIKACSTLQNLLDKRSHFAPSTISLPTVCPVRWLMAPVAAKDATLHWKLIRLLKEEPIIPLVLLIRDVQVLYGPEKRQNDGFARTQMLQAHEYSARWTPLQARKAPATRRCGR